MKLPFLYDHLRKSSIDHKEEILEALVTHNWKITNIGQYEGVNANKPVIDLESDGGYWLNLIPLDLFSKEVLAEELIKYLPRFMINKK